MTKSLAFSVLFLLYGSALFATHIVGGEMQYECLGFNSATQTGEYRITLKVYRDCYNGVPWFDYPAHIGIYTGDGQFVKKVDVPPLSNDTLPIQLDNPCLLAPNGLCVNVARYEAMATLPYNASGYYFVYQRCCRNEILNNITDPEQTGATYFVFASGAAQLACNSSPRWADYPPVTICLGSPLSQSHAAIDAENDQITYSFCAPFAAADTIMPYPDPPGPPPYVPVVYDTNYVAAYPMGGNPLIDIDPITGLITGTPDRLGSFVLGVCGAEYRNGVLFSLFTRDFQYIVSSCTNSRIQTKLNAATCDTSLSEIELQVSNGVSPYAYLWSSGETTKDLPLVVPGLTYTVTITDGEGCTSVISIAGNDCVWPGDANYDGEANNLDILALGLMYGDNGPVRPAASLNWTPQTALFWNAYQPGGINAKHADCDGSGSINRIDADAVIQNYAKTHPTAFFGGSQSANAPLLRLSFEPAVPLPGELVTAYIQLGTADQPAINAYGIAFTVLCDHPELIDPLVMPSGSFASTVFGRDEHIVQIFRPFAADGLFDFAVCNTTRKSFNTLYGPVAMLTFQMGDVAPGLTAQFSFTNVQLIDDLGNILPVAIENGEITTGVFTAADPAKTLSVVPNPSSGWVNLLFDQTLSTDVQVELYDCSGRLCRSQILYDASGKQIVPLDLTGFLTGIYWVRVQDAATVYLGKVMLK